MDLIDRAAAIEHLRNNIAYMRAFGCDRAITLIREVPSAQPEKRTVEHTETHACDLISRQALCDYALNQKDKSVTPNDIMRFPSAQPEIIRCKDCKWSDWYTAADGNRYCYCMETSAAGRTEDDYCSYAERETNAAN